MSNRKTSNRTKSKVKSQAKSYNHGDFIAATTESEGFEIIVVEDIQGQNLKIIPLTNLGKGYYLYPKNDRREAWVNAQRVIGSVSLLPTENKRCCMLTEEENNRNEIEGGDTYD